MNRKTQLNFWACVLMLLVNACYALAIEKKSVDVLMRDGIKVKADVYLPEGNGPFPVVLNRTPYNRNGLKGEAEKFTEHGIAFVAVDVRGRFESEGEFIPFVYEGADGTDTLKWLASQPWCNGKVAGNGGSYVGYTQWALTSETHDGLVTIVPVFTTANIYEVAYRNGAFNLSTALGWSSGMYDKNKIDSIGYIMSRRALKILPLIETDNKTGHQIDFYDDWLRHPTLDEFWEPMNYSKNFKTKNFPVLMIAGWYDLFLGPQLKDFVRMMSDFPAEVSQRSSIIIGPWDHSGSLISTKVNPPIIDLPKDAKEATVLLPIVYGWYDFWLLGKDNPAAHLPRVRLFVMGSNRWEDFNSWPPAGIKPTPWYLHSSGVAATPEDGANLSPTQPVTEPPDTYIYDPQKPAPSRGGAVLGTEMGPYDYSEEERNRPDILSYTSQPLESELEIIGPVTMKLYASTTACGTDFAARLLDVKPDGIAVPIVEGIVRTQASPESAQLKTSEVAEHEIDLWATAYTFLPGHRLRIDVTSSAFPHWDRNLNICDKPFGMSKKSIVSTQTIFHDSSHPSHIILPVFSKK